MQIKEIETSPKYLCLYSDKSDSKSFQTKFETPFLQVSVTIWHLSIKERVRKKAHVHFSRKEQRYWFGKQTQVQWLFFSSKQFNYLTESIIHFHQSLVREEYLSKL